MNTHCYLVFRGRVIGLFEHWSQVIPQIEHYKNFSVRRYEVAEKAFSDWEKFEQTGIIPKKAYPKNTVILSYLNKTPKNRNLKKRAKNNLKRRTSAAIATGGPIGGRTIACAKEECKYPFCRCE